MTAQSLIRRLFAAFLSISLISGCFSTDQSGDKSNRVVQGWDDFPNKALPDLKELSDKLNRLPVPMGTQYNVEIPRKPMPSDPCPNGPREIFGLSLPDRGIYVVDTIQYFDAEGKASCQWQAGATVRQTNNRHILDLNSGESWETLVDSISEGDVMPAHRISGKGRILHNSGLELEIKSYSLNILIPYGTPNAIITDGHLSLYWKKGYTIELGIAITKPYSAPDFFPVRAPGNSDILMSGRIRHDTVTVGFFDLTSDHGVRIRDWKNNSLALPSCPPTH